MIEEAFKLALFAGSRYLDREAREERRRQREHERQLAEEREEKRNRPSTSVGVQMENCENVNITVNVIYD